MAQSPDSADGRAHLIRQMSRHGDRSISVASNGSSAGSGHGQFQPNDTDSQQLPPLRPEQDFQINTSALRRAFPNFSQTGSSDEDSIEMGRGLRGSTKAMTNRDLPSEDVTENMPFTFGNGAKYRVTGTPPIKPRNVNVKTATTSANNIKRDMYSKSASTGKEDRDGVKETRYGSASSKENDDNAERRMSDLQARVESDESVSFVDGRPGAIDTSTRNTRFGNRRAKQAVYSEEPLQSGTRTSLASGVNATHQSFVLPDMPNITELISGVRQDGTPLFARSAKSRPRFSTPSRSRRPNQSHVPAESVPVPIDEKALYVSIQLLQEKVMALELEKTQSEMKLDDYELEVLQLKSKLEERHYMRHSDSGIGTDPDDAKATDTQGEKSKLEFSIRTLQDRLERTGRKVSKSEVTIQNLTNDRDAVHQQLAVAFLNSEELKNESQNLRDELESIKTQVTELNHAHEKKINQLTKQEKELRNKIERREKAINEMSSLAKELWETRNALATSSAPSNIMLSLASQVPEQLQLKKNRLSCDSHPRTISKSTATTGDTSRRQPESNVQRHMNNHEDDAASNVESTTNITLPRASNAHELTKNSTYMSFMEGDEVSKLRRVVEEDKVRLACSRGERPALPRKSSLKKVQYEGDETRRNGGYAKNVRDDNTIEDISKTNRGVYGESQYTQQSIASQLSARRRRSGTTDQTEMTSAFILPDITLSATTLPAHPRLGQAKDIVKQTISIARPIPVSDRIPASADGEPDVTLRPAQSPAIALAAVLKGLENELAELRVQLAYQESLYHKHDPALSKQKRKIVYARMQRLLSAIEIRADQIYALYDVLEGQKANGQTMKEGEVEVTLQGIGIDLAMLHASGKSGTRARNFQDVVDDEDDSASASNDDHEQSEELPWEGFEPTRTNTLDNIGRLGKR